ncbi:MAG: hypothetical protein NVS2B3_02290 [Vulcanimicrobiaceae bacterium]
MRYTFGSYATGDVAPTSDLDVLVVREAPLRRVFLEDDVRGLAQRHDG